MARPLRLEHCGALWHVTARGNERKVIVRDDADRTAWVEQLGKVVEWLGWRLHAYVLMDNHYHLLLETPEPNLSRGMREINGRHGQAFNRRHGRVGHLFQGRFKGILVEKESHLLELCRYVVLNPVRARVVKNAGAWRWSNYRATAGLERAPAWLEFDWTLRQFGVKRSRTRARYREFVAEGVDARPWDELEGQIYLGGPEFRRRMADLAGEWKDEREVPVAQRLPSRPSVEELWAAVAEVCATTASAIRTGRGGSARALVAHLGRRLCRERLRPLGALLGVDIGRVSQLAAEGARLCESDRNVRRSVEAIESRLAATGKLNEKL